MYPFKIILLSFSLVFSLVANAEFKTKYSCKDEKKICSKPGGYKFIDRVKIYKGCWEYSYIKTCNVPSRDDCRPLIEEGCIYRSGAGTQTKCLAKNIDGSCVNQQREYTCIRSLEKEIEEEEIVVDPDDQQNKKHMICSGIPCLDGSCIEVKDKNNDELGQTLAMLKTAAAMGEGVKGDLADSLDLTNINVDIFPGNLKHCNKKALSYTNCCVDKGWGKILGARCSSEEKALMKARGEGLCLAAGSKCTKRILGQCIIRKNYFCCYDNKFAKAVNQIRSDGYRASGPNCRGFTLEEIEKIDFKKDVDLREFEQDLFKAAIKNIDKFKGSVLQDRLKSNLPEINKTKPDTELEKSGSDISVFTTNINKNSSSDHSYTPGNVKKWQQKTGSR